MRAFRLAWSLLLVPRLFATLFLFPLLLSLVLVYIQLIATGVVLKSTETHPDAVARNLATYKKNDLARRLLFGGKPVPELQVCRWEPVIKDGKVTGEGPPTESCQPDNLDAAIQVPEPSRFDSSEYEKIFSGVVERLHICVACHPHVVIRIENGKIVSRVKSIWGWLIVHLTRYNDDLQENFIKAAAGFQNIRDLFGTMYFEPYGLARPARVSGVKTTLAVMINVSSIVVIALWLALKAHRRVLDYFARSGALLPLVAATGNQSFYGAIWILTAARVGFFLFASIPMLLAFLYEVVVLEPDDFFRAEELGVALWIIALLIGLCLATLIASIADLKHRHGFLSFTYRYVPLGICALGALLWGATFIVDSNAMGVIRSIIAGTPFVGLTAILLTPVFEQSPFVLSAHIVFSFAILVGVLKLNARWFAAHLEEL